MGLWHLRLRVKILAFLRLTINFFVRLAEVLKINSEFKKKFLTYRATATVVKTFANSRYDTFGIHFRTFRSVSKHIKGKTR